MHQAIYHVAYRHIQTALEWHQQFFIRITANHGSPEIDEELTPFESDEPGEDENAYYDLLCGTLFGIDMPVNKPNFALKNPEIIKEWHPTKKFQKQYFYH